MIERLRQTERWIAWVRLAAVAFALAEVGLVSQHYPPGYERWAWATTATFGLGTLLIFQLSRSARTAASLRRTGVLALLFDAAIVSAYVFVFSYEPGTPIRQLVFLPVVEAALRLGILGSVGLSVLLLPTLALSEHWRAHRFAPPAFTLDHVTFPFGIAVLLGLIVGWLVNRLDHERLRVESRAVEAEELRDELGRRANVLDAANRCARALSSSLDLDEAFGAFIRELRGLVPFDRVAIVLADDGAARVMAAAGSGAESIFPAGTSEPVAGTLLEDVIERAQTVYREELDASEYPEEAEFLRLGLHCRLAAPLLLGAGAIGMLSLVRERESSFEPGEIELAGLLGRLVATAVQNIRSYDAERRTVEELRRLSALRADFVSLVSHELRSPMAAVIGSARTLRERWRELSPAQRESFLALIADETERLATLVGDVLDSSRIEAGTFSYRFADVDVGQLVREAAAAASVQDEVPVDVEVQEGLPLVRGDAERLRQVCQNLIDNAVKYSPHGEPVEVRASAMNGRLVVAVRDRGPGIAQEDRRLIFEKFGRVHLAGVSKPGTGLGLFIARSIAEAHGGTLEVGPNPGGGATFTFALPVDRPN